MGHREPRKKKDWIDRGFCLSLVDFCYNGRIGCAPPLASTQRETQAELGGRPERKKEAGMATGTVKWFNDSKGYGFIVQDGGGEDVFCHHSSIQMDGFRTLAEGQKVQFDVAQGPKGLQAQNVRPT
jgi:cold shock protein